MPVVTLPGRFTRVRRGTAILTTIGVTETIGRSLDEYVALAAYLGSERERCRQRSEGVIIGEDANTVRLSHAEWNELVRHVSSGTLREV